LEKEALRKALEEKLDDNDIKVDDISIYVKPLDEDKVMLRYEIIIVIDENRLYYDGLAELCSQIDVDDGEVDDGELEKAFSECVEEEIKEFRAKYGYPRAKITYNDGFVRARTATECYETSMYYVCRDLIIVNIERKMSVDAIKFNVDNHDVIERAAYGYAEYIVRVVDGIINLLP